MKLTGLHLLLTYQCNYECDHCFVWSSPQQRGTMSLAQVRDILLQGRSLDTVEWIYFEGGEPFLYYPVMLSGARLACDLGFRVGIVTNGYWATGKDDALEWLRPLSGIVEDLSVSSDLFHADEAMSAQARYARTAAERLGIPSSVISIAQPEETGAASSVGQLPSGESGVRFRGRAAENLVARAALEPWTRFTECPYENLREPGRVHVDPLGYVHVCQGVTAGNMFRESLAGICERYDPDSDPVIGPLLEGGPVELVNRYGLPHEESYADACHLCYRARCSLRRRHSEILAPDQVYGVMGGPSHGNQVNP